MFDMEKFIDRHGNKLFWALMLTGIAPLLFYDTEFNIPYILAFKYASIPVLTISYVISVYYMPNWRRKTGPAMKVVMPLLVSAIVVLFMGGHVIAANALVGTQHERLITGEIIDMNTSGGRTTTYTATVIDSNTREQKRLEISTNEFKSYRIGDAYQKLWYEGSLGFLYLKK